MRKPGFLLFSGGIERDQWHEMGFEPLLFKKKFMEKKPTSKGCNIIELSFKS